MGGRWAVGSLTQKRFTAYIAEKYGAPPGAIGSASGQVVYGTGSTDGTRSIFDRNRQP
jgi:hypothetical protein